jgi:cysteine desulfurase
LGLPAECLYFTSGGTESNALTIHGVGIRKSGGTLLFSAVEHPSVRENLLLLEGLGKPVASIGVEKDGRVTEARLGQSLENHPHTRFAAIMGVNNEIGSIMDIPGLVTFIRNRGKGPPIHLHSDLVQAAGKIPLNLPAWDLDSASFSAHKIGGPRGIGLLYLRKPLKTLYAGGGQEGGMRPGTENVSGALALAECLERRACPERVKAEYAAAMDRFKGLIRFLRETPGCSLIPQDRQEEDERFSPYILQGAFRGIPGEVMVRGLDDAGFGASTGSACSSASQERPVLAALGLDPQTQREGIRISQGWSTRKEDIAGLCEAIKTFAGRFGFGK